MSRSAEVEELRAENRKLRDVLEWVNTQCPGKCAGVCDAALRDEAKVADDLHREREKVIAYLTKTANELERKGDPEWGIVADLALHFKAGFHLREEEE